ncbi:MAG TPA: hypothetical protein VH306_09365 [Gaiellaceae bacterium]
MDLQLYTRVLLRFRYLVGGGLALAIVLALFSYYSISPSGVGHRTSETWQAETTLFLTQAGFPDGQTLPQYVNGPDGAVPLADSGRMNGLAFTYSKLVMSDDVRARVGRGGPIDGTYQAAAATDPNTGATAPLVTITTTAASADAAASLASRVATAFRRYIVFKQETANPPTPSAQRVLVQEISKPETPILVSGYKKTAPVIVFLAVAVATIGLAFILENLRPRVHVAAPAAAETRQVRARSTRRRTA